MFSLSTVVGECEAPPERQEPTTSTVIVTSVPLDEAEREIRLEKAFACLVDAVVAARPRNKAQHAETMESTAKLVRST